MMERADSSLDNATSLPVRAALWAAWLAGATFLVVHHVMWRDEIRALMLAGRGGTLGEMIVQIRGYGHPALWHILLRSALTLYPGPIVLPILAFVIGAMASALLAFKAPFRPFVLALALFGAFSIYEYVALARNYGISVLILFTIAWAYGRFRDRPGLIGLLLFALCNTNIHSVVLAGAFLLFWAVDLLRSDGKGNARALRSFTVAAFLTLAGVAACFWQVYPPVDDAAMLPSAKTSLLSLPTLIATRLGPAFYELMPPNLRDGLSVIILLPALLLVNLLELRRSSAALVATMAALIGLETVFLVIYPGSYRHQALFIAFLLTMLWIVEDSRTQSGSEVARDGIRPALIVLLALQVYSSALIFARVASGIPESRSRDLAALLARPTLQDAILLGDPDTMLEPVSYYVQNPIYLVRERRFGRTPTFSHAAARQPMTIGRILSSAQALHARTHRPIVIALTEPLDPGMAYGERDRGYYGTLIVRREEVGAFLAATQRIARFAPAATDESYDVYVLSDDASRVRARALTSK